MFFLFEDKNGRSTIKFCIDWSAAEKYARDNDLSLLGEYIGEV